MTKVCHMTSVHPPEDVRIFHKECVSLAKAGYETYLVQQGESGEEKGVHIVGVGAPPKGRLKRMTVFSRRVYRTALALDADVYHLHDPELLPWGLKLKRKGKKVIFDSHERYVIQIREKYYLPSWCRKLAASCYDTYEKYVLKRIDGLVFPCLQNGRHPFEGRCRHIAIVDNVALLSEMDTEIPAECNKGRFSLCYVGGIRPDRGITQDVIACNLTGTPLLLGGSPSSPEYIRQLTELDKKKLVEFRGQLDRKQVFALLHEASAGLVTELSVGQNNTTDNLPTKTYEYMACGLPVIISDYPYAKELIKRLRFGICVDPENIDEIAAAITYLLDHPEEARRMGENGRRAVEAEFNWGVEEKKLLALYAELSESVER